jgi:hypothetical protein
VVQPGCNFNSLFQNEWLEVAILPPPSTLHDTGGGGENGGVEGAGGGGKFFLPKSTESPERILDQVSDHFEQQIFKSNF